MSELSFEAKALIARVGRDDGPHPGDRARVKRRLVAALAGAGVGVGGGASLASSASGVAASSAAVKITTASVALWLVTGAGLGVLASVPAFVSTFRGAPKAAAVEARPHAPSATLSPAAGSEGPGERSLSDRAGAEPESVPRPPLPRAHAAAARVEPELGATSLGEETHLLQAAQQELAARRTTAALALLDEHAARFPDGVLAVERSAARVLALCDLGRTAEARRAAQAFIRSSPQSPLVPRLRGSCALAERPRDGSRE